MKKKFAAAFVALALAAAMPAAAFADNSIEAQSANDGSGNVIVDTSGQGNGDMTSIVVGGNVAGVYANNFGTTITASQTNAKNFATAQGDEASNKAMTDARKAYADQKKAAEITLGRADATDQEKEAATAELENIESAVLKAGADAKAKWNAAEWNYNKAVGSFANINGNEVISTFGLEGESVGSMNVTVVLDKGKYAGHTVTAIILNDDGTITEKTMVVDKNGCIKIEKNGFCVWTLVDCSGGLPAGTVVEGVSTSDFEKALSVAGNATDKGTSPKTGC